MKRVTGIGGIFFKARDPAAPWDWYRGHLAIDVQPWGGAAFAFAGAAGEPEYGRFGWVMDSEGNKAELRQPPEGK